MKDIGLFFDDRTAMRAAYYSEAYSLIKHPVPGLVIEDRFFRITVGDVCRSYYYTGDKNWKHAIAGIQFQGVLINVKSTDDQAWIMSRFRPQ